MANNQINARTVDDSMLNCFEPANDYSEILKQFGLEFRHVGFHLHVGEVKLVQGWLLHISIVRSQINEVLQIVIPILILSKTAFKIVEDKETAHSLLDGNFGHSMIGKVLTVYPESDLIALSLAKTLVAATTSFRGPKVLTDIHLGGLIYTRYGGFNPVSQVDSTGKRMNYIFNIKKELVPDIEHIPFQKKDDLAWPFGNISSPSSSVNNGILNNKYKPISNLKVDAKGNVIKALYIKKSIWINWCVIKQGRLNMWHDESGRDMADRIFWQHEMHKKLEKTVSIPKVIDLFISDGDAYLVMEYVKGLCLMDKIYELNKSCVVWHKWPLKNKLIVFDYILKIVEIIGKIHELGFIHRDITPVNFIVTKKNTLTLIDNEMLYDSNVPKPYIPYIAGTHGFMSPQQVHASTPTFSEDIYALGACLVSLLTGLAPTSFETKNKQRLTSQLFFHLQDEQLTNLIVKCHEIEVENRPTLPQLKLSLEDYLNRLNAFAQEPAGTLSNSVSYQDPLKVIINEAIKGLVKAPTPLNNDIWLSKANARDNVISKQRTEFCKSLGFREGICGTLYCVANAKYANLDITPCMVSYKKGWEYVVNGYISEKKNITAGLYGGTSGIAVAMAKGISSGLLENNTQNRSFIQELLSHPNLGLDIATGVAGQGLSVLECQEFIDREFTSNILQQFVTTLIHSQTRKGTWLFLKNKFHRSYNFISYSYGNTGITLFLLEIMYKYPNNNLRVVIVKSLNSLHQEVNHLIRRFEKEGNREFILGDSNFLDGVNGLILVFIKAFEVLQENSYKLIAENILFYYLSDTIVHDNIYAETGLVGLGEIYIEAYRCFKNPVWKNRAEWLIKYFINSARFSEDGGIFWLGNNSPFPTADLLVGNSGIIQFFIKYYIIKNS